MTIEEALKIFANPNENIDNLTLRLCYDRIFCELAELNYNRIDYSQIKLEILKYRSKS